MQRATTSNLSPKRGHEAGMAEESFPTNREDSDSQEEASSSISRDGDQIPAGIQASSDTHKKHKRRKQTG